MTISPQFFICEIWAMLFLFTSPTF